MKWKEHDGNSFVFFEDKQYDYIRNKQLSKLVIKYLATTSESQFCIIVQI